MNKKGIIIISIVSTVAIVTTVVLILILTKKQDKPIVEDQNIFSTPEYVYLSNLAKDFNDSDTTFIVDAAAQLSTLMSQLESNEKIKDADKQELRELYKLITSDDLVSLEEIEKVKNKLTDILNDYSDDPDISKNLNKIKNASYTFTQEYIISLTNMLRMIKTNNYIKEGEYQELLLEASYLKPEDFVTYQDKLMKIIDKNQSTKGQITSLQYEQNKLEQSTNDLNDSLEITIDTMVKNEIINEERAKQLKAEMKENSVKVANEIAQILTDAQEDTNITNDMMTLLQSMSDDLDESLTIYMEDQKKLNTQVLTIFDELLDVVASQDARDKMNKIKDEVLKDGIVTENEMNDLINSLRDSNISKSVDNLQSAQKKFDDAMKETVKNVLKQIDEILPKYAAKGELENKEKESKLIEIKNKITASSMATADQIEEVQSCILNAEMQQMMKDIDDLGDKYAISTKSLEEEITNLLVHINMTFLGITKEEAKNIKYVKGDKYYDKLCAKNSAYEDMIQKWLAIRGKKRGEVSHDEYQKFQNAINAMLTSAETANALQTAKNEALAYANSAENNAYSNARSYTNSQVNPVKTRVSTLEQKLAKIESENKALATLVFSSDLDSSTVNNNPTNFKGALGTFIDSGRAIQSGTFVTKAENDKLKNVVNQLARIQAENELNYRVTGVGIDANNAQRTILSEDKRIMLFEDAMKKVYPIGSIMIRYDSTNPNALPGLSGTTWVLISTSGNHALVAVDNSNLKSTGKIYNGSLSSSGTFTSASHQLTSSEMPSHSHSLIASTTAAGEHSHKVNVTASKAGLHSHRGRALGGAHYHQIKSAGSHSHHINAGIYGNDSGERNAYNLSKNRSGWWTAPSGEHTHEMSISGTHTHELNIEDNGAHTHTINGNTEETIAHTHKLNATTFGAGGNSGHAHGISLPSVFIAVWRRTE